MSRLLCSATLATALVIPFFSTMSWAQPSCSSAGSTLNRVQCKKPELQYLREALARKAELWQRNCNGSTDQAAERVAPHAAWLAGVYKGYELLTDVKAEDYLGSTFTQRADELSEALYECVHKPGHGIKALHITMVQLPATPEQEEPSRIPFVQTTPELVGARINEQLYRSLLQTRAPVSPKDADVREALSEISGQASEDISAAETLDASVLWRSPRLLVLQVTTSGCETRCWENSEQILFDLRTGDRIEPVDLLRPEARQAVDQLTAESVLAEASKLRQRDSAQWTPDGIETFEHCLKEWQGWRGKGGEQIVWLDDKHWIVRGPACTGDDEAMPPTIDSQKFTLDVLAPHLSLYGRSLLLGDGEQQSSVLPLEACTAPGTPPDPQNWAAQVAEISAGSDHTWLREPSGKVWGWGRNYEGSLGEINGGADNGDWIPPFVLGTDFSYVGAGADFSAAVAHDGSLWTWGTGYGGRLGDGDSGRYYPQRIADHMVRADVSNAGGLALAEDGRLWAWGMTKPTIAVIATNVSQFSGNTPIFMIKRDGSLWGWQEWYWTPPGESKPAPDVQHWHGNGFSRLPKSRHLDLAWRADGTVWAWGRTLASMGTPAALPGLDQSPWPRLVGRDWVDIKTSDDYTFVAGRKSDGSLWVSQERGQQMRMSRLGCGFADMAFAYDRAQGIHLLALRSDGRLLDYHGSREANGYIDNDLLDQQPEELASGGVTLFQENDYQGNVGAVVFLLKQDGTLWRWYWQFRGQYPVQGLPPAQRLEQIKFPDEWFKEHASRR